MHPDAAVRAAALNTVRELIGAGLAGLDSVDCDIFVVDAPQALRDNADVALDHLGASFHRQGAYRAPVSVLQCRLPVWVSRELGLFEPDAPRIDIAILDRAEVFA